MTAHQYPTTPTTLDQVPPWLDTRALLQVLDHAHTGNLCRTPDKGPHLVDGQDCPELPRPEQDAADFADAVGLVTPEGCSPDGRTNYALTAAGRGLHAAGRGGWL